jgi:hypothetical protein
VQIRNRLAEMDDQVEGVGDTDMEDEKADLRERLLILQDQLATGGPRGSEDSPSQPDTVQYVPPS